MSFVVTGGDIPANCFRCPLDKGVRKPEQDPFILCRYTKEIVRYDDVPTDRRLPCCGLKEIPEKHGRLIDADTLVETFSRLNDDDWQLTRGDHKWMESVLFEMPTIVEEEV